MGGSHSRQRPVDGIHTPIAFEYANSTVRNAATGFDTTYDLYKIAVDLDTKLLFYISETTPSIVWTPFAGASVTLTGAAPANVTKAAAAVGVSGQAARADHKHDITTAAPSAISTANSEGTSTALARADHIHSHGNLAGGALHAAATTSVNGFLSASDKTKLDGVATGATATPLSSSAPANVTKDTAVIGVSTTAARSDHRHDITTGVPSTVGTANSEGAGTALARADHVHSHGNQAGGALHAVATTSVAGFLSAADKTKLDALSFGSDSARQVSEAESSTSSGTPQIKVALTVSGLASGTYRVGWTCKYANNYNQGVVDLYDSTGAAVLDEASPEHRGTAKYQGEGGFVYITFSGARTFQIRYWSLGGAVFIKQARIEFWRVA